MPTRQEAGHCVARVARCPTHTVRSWLALLPIVHQLSWTALCRASFNGQLRVAEVLIRHNASVNVVNGIDRSPLFLAALGGHAAVVRLLLDHGADVRVRAHSVSGVRGVCRAVLQRLLRRSACCCDCVMCVQLGQNPLIASAAVGSLPVTELLLARGCNPNGVPDSVGYHSTQHTAHEHTPPHWTTHHHTTRCTPAPYCVHR
jgi:ankyrin repeat protein